MNELRRFAATAVACAALLIPAVAHAVSARTTSHTFERVWPSAVRFIRVDQGYDIIDKDPETGYVLFEFDDDDRRFRGSLELVRTTDSSGNPELRMVMNLYDRPTWMEDMVMNKLAQKIRDEHGDPPAPKPKPKPKPKKPDKPDGDPNEGEDEPGRDGDDKNR